MGTSKNSGIVFRGARRVFNKSININDLLKTSQIKIKEKEMSQKLVTFGTSPTSLKLSLYTVMT